MPETGLYRRISILVDGWLDLHKGETFDLDLLCRQLEIRERDNRNYVTQKLSYEVRQRRLEKDNRTYRWIDNTCKKIVWYPVPGEGGGEGIGGYGGEGDPLDLTWPYGHEDESTFGFDGFVTISPGDVVVIAGQSNAGKTCFCLNVLWDNMDKYPCTLMGNEYTAGKFSRRTGRMTWKNPLKEDGTPKFELIERYDNWKDIIRPDNINIIDWINLGDNFYQMGKLIEGIQSKLRGGMALISLQKSGDKAMGLGGDFSRHLATLYLSIDPGRLMVVKAKEWHDVNPNNAMFGFEIIEGGTQFHNIRPVKKCPICRGMSAINRTDCELCYGKGYIDIK